jgi:hypothetical protein
MELEGSLPYSQQPANCPHLSHMQPLHIFLPYFPKIHSNTIIPYTSTSLELYLPFGVSDQNFVYIFHPSHAYNGCPQNGTDGRD